MERNASVKLCPESWQTRDTKIGIDLVIAYDFVVYNILVEDANKRQMERDTWDGDVGVIIGLPIRDNHEDASDGAEKTVKLLEIISRYGMNWKDKLEEICKQFEIETKRCLFFTITPFLI